MSLDDRKAAILSAVVQEYIETAQPVGSGHVSESPGVGVSPATVRNDMVLLEQDGYLEQPHTSAGRIPTDKGYRFFVDALDEPGLARAQNRRVADFFAQTHGEIEQMLEDTTRLLSDLTRYAAVVVGPDHEATTIRSAQLVPLSHNVMLLVVVLSSGVVEKRVIETSEDISDVMVAAASVRVSERLVGIALSDIASDRGDVAVSGNHMVDAVVNTAVSALVGGDVGVEHVYVGGAAQMAGSFDAIDTVKQVLGFLEEQLVVVTIMRDVLGRGLSVAIGEETGLEPLADCSLVVSPYEIDGEQVGTIGVLGPTRMDYQRSLAAVAIVGQRLGTHLSDT